jgi:hypothetical protein
MYPLAALRDVPLEHLSDEDVKLVFHYHYLKDPGFGAPENASTHSHLLMQ